MQRTWPIHCRRLTSWSDNLVALRVAMPILAVAGVWLLAIGHSPAASSSLGSLAGGRSDPSGLGSASEHCVSCHRMESVLSHPVNISASMDVPADLPLESGRLGCLTCHDDRALTDHARRSEGSASMLRGADSAQQLCGRCHTPGGPNAKEMHAATLNRAHLGVPAASSISSASWQTLDDESRYCLGCHDGSMASDVGLGRDGPAGSHANSHPVAIAYKDPRSLASDTLLSAGSLDQRIRLFDGRVGCGSCHSLYSREPALLAAPNHRSQLCLCCHRYR